MKFCPRCDTVLPLESFGKNRAQYDGLQTWCFACRREWKAARAPDVKRVERRAHKDRQIEHHRARKAVQKAVARGTLIRPDVCETCGVVCRPQGHHEDYTRRFEVRWLCTGCHTEVHRVSS